MISLLPIYAYLSQLSGAREKWQKNWPLPQLQSHRGYIKSGAIENTTASLEAAARLGFQMVEFDIRLSQDKVPYLHHDETLIRLFGDSRPINAVDADELDRMGLSRLEDVLLDQSLPSALNIEIKNSSLTKFETEFQVLKILKEIRHQKEIVFSSFNPMSCLFLSQNQRNFPVAHLICEFDDPENSAFLKWGGGSFFSQADWLHLSYQELTEQRVQSLNQMGINICAWTVNDLAMAKQLLQWGVKSIITDEVTPHSLLEH